MRSDDGLYRTEETVADKQSNKKEKPAGVRERITDEARSWVGTPYRYGGQTRGGTDCSGLVMTVFLDVAGIRLPRNSAEQSRYCKPLKPSDLIPGDLVFFRTGRSRDINHVGIYVGNGCFVHASTSRGVIVSDLDQDYYRRTFVQAGRVGALGDARP